MNKIIYFQNLKIAIFSLKSSWIIFYKKAFFFYLDTIQMVQINQRRKLQRIKFVRIVLVASICFIIIIIVRAHKKSLKFNVVRVLETFIYKNIRLFRFHYTRIFMPSRIASYINKINKTNKRILRTINEIYRIMCGVCWRTSSSVVAHWRR